MGSPTDIANHALVLLGETALLTSLDEDRASARALRVVFEPERDAELRKHVWNFAKRRVTLAPLMAADAGDFSYAYQLPADFLRVVPTDDLWRYEVANGVLRTDAGPALSLAYVARVTETGLWDALFGTAMAARLAMVTCLAITGSSERHDRAKAAYRDAMADARRVDAVENPPDDLPDDDWVKARSGT